MACRSCWCERSIRELRRHVNAWPASVMRISDPICSLEPEVETYPNPHIVEGVTVCPGRIVVNLQGTKVQFLG